MTDAQLLERVRQDDSSAWQALYERLFPSVWRAAYARLSDRAAAEDVVSETFLALVRNLSAIEADSSRLHGWMLQVARNKASDFSRRRSCRARVLNELSIQGQESLDADPATAALVDEKRQAVLQVLEGMRLDYRLALEWKYAEGLSVREIAGRMGQTEKSTESLLYRARVEFRRAYEMYNRDAVSSEVAQPDGRV